MVKIMMKNDDIIEFNYYSDIAEYIGHELIFFEQYGDYQGDWIMVSKEENIIHFWRGYYGSCFGCDELQGHFGYEDDCSKEHCDDFVYAYKPEMSIDLKDINFELILKFIKKQQLTDDYDLLNNKQCEDIAKDIFKDINK